MAVIRMLFFFSTVFVMLVEISAAPARYDQRQDGNVNVHAKLENFLFVVAIPSNNELLSDLALQALELKQLVSRASSSSKEQGSIKSGEEVHSEEPYSVEIIRVNENHSDEESMVRKAEEEKKEASNVLNQQPTSLVSDEKESTERVGKNVKAFDFPKSREVPAVLGYFMDARKVLGSKMENGGRARNVVGNVWNSDIEPSRPGTSLKKQLPRTGEEDVAPSSSSADKNNVASSSEEKQQELVLLGDGIENCGPGRRRDVSGICEFDESAESLL